MAERTCIVSRTVHDPDDMIRFVAGPDGSVVPDLKRNLPGRGVWVTARRSFVERAIAKSAFARGLKAPVKADKSLPDLVDTLMANAALGSLGFARKAGECIIGASKVEKALASGKVLALLHATDGAEDGARKLSHAAYAARTQKGRTAPIWREFNSMQLGLALGATNVIHAALMKGGAARNCAQLVSRLVDYRQDTDLSDGVSGQKNDIPQFRRAIDIEATGTMGREGKDVDE